MWLSSPCLMIVEELLSKLASLSQRFQSNVYWVSKTLCPAKLIKKCILVVIYLQRAHKHRHMRGEGSWLNEYMHIHFWIYSITSSLFLGFTWHHKLCLSQCPPCWCPSGVTFMLIIIYFYSDASLLALIIISPTTGISRNKKSR